MILLNEKRFAESCLKIGLNGQKPYFVLSILASYYSGEGYKKKEIREKLMDYLRRFYPRYDLDECDWEEIADKLSANAGKRELFEIEGVSISKKEIETIKSIKDKVLERLAFTLLCIAKLNNAKNPKNNGWVNTDAKDIFSYARVTCSAFDRDVKIGMLGRMGLLEFPKRLDNLNIRVIFISDDGEEALFVSDFRELGYEYLLYSGQNFIRCAECGILIRGNKNGTKLYCRNCAAYTPKEMKEIYCVDCGKKFTVPPNNRRSVRCTDCQSRYRREQQNKWKRLHYEQK